MVAAPTANNRGTVDTVVSCSEVSTCTTLVSRPTKVATISSGAPIHSAASSVCRMICAISSGPIRSSFFFLFIFLLCKALHQRTHHRVPAVDHHEQHDFERC